MPIMTIEISEQQEAKIVDAISEGRTFTIDGGDIDMNVENGDGTVRKIKSVTFEFGE